MVAKSEAAAEPVGILKDDERELLIGDSQHQTGAFKELSKMPHETVSLVRLNEPTQSVGQCMSCRSHGRSKGESTSALLRTAGKSAKQYNFE
jgi:hypothetical protein